MASIKPLIGVNLGGWLVLEPWMTPSLFKDTGAVDEYTYCATADAPGRRRLKQFRDTFIQEADIAWLAANRVDAVRVPVGYWLFGEQTPYLATYRYLDHLFSWADKHDVKVLISLHGAPGSQNGEMHSGHKGSITWPQPSHIEETVVILERLAKRYGKRSSLLGISLLNEPSRSIPIATLNDFYDRAEAAVKQYLPPDAWLVFSDSFRPWQWQRRVRHLALDHHRYQIFTVLDRLAPAWLHVLRAGWFLPVRTRLLARRHRLIIGEWSLALPGKRSRPVYRRYGTAQLRALQHADAWFYWSYKTEYGGPWSFRNNLENGCLIRDKML